MNTPNSSQLRVIDAVTAQDGAPFFHLEGPSGTCWISGSDPQKSKRETIDLIDRRTGAHLYTTRTYNEFLDLLQNTLPERDVLVAYQPGWTGDAFVVGDGRIIGEGIEIVTFDPIEKFSPAGTLEDWQVAIDPFIANQPLPFFVCALALAGPVYRFFEDSIFPPQVELVGEPRSGKSTLGILAASTGAGRAHGIGGAESWNMTQNGYELLRRLHRDHFLVLDEAEGSGQHGAARRDFAQSIVFQGATSTSKVRYTDEGSAPPISMPVLSTTNTPLRDVLRGASSNVIDAATSRMPSIRVVRSEEAVGLPVLDRLPTGYTDLEAAVRGLRGAVGNAYATALPAFVDYLVERLSAEGDALQERIRLEMGRTRDRLRRTAADGDSRHRDMLAAVEVTATLAQEAGVLLQVWGSPAQIVDVVHQEIVAYGRSTSVRPEDEYRRFWRYVAEQRKRQRVGSLHVAYLPSERFPEGCPIMIDPDEAKAYVEPDHFNRTFPGAFAFLRRMRDAGRLLVNDSEAHRLQIHAPSAMKRLGFGRVFAIRLDEKDARRVLTRRFQQRR
ncbi:DUF927 domain-containing protein [Pararhizobium mangrovi]|nr:DUF927 domain-containing protein [Pararhizobium mangrovi]